MRVLLVGGRSVTSDVIATLLYDLLAAYSPWREAVTSLVSDVSYVYHTVSLKNEFIMTFAF